MRTTPPGYWVPKASGQSIFAYVRLRTNQVLYTFSRTLKDHDLKQLPDIGANVTPPAIRPDEWRPLWTASFHKEAPTVLTQYVFEKLLAYRRLHELCWQPPKELTKVHTEEEIEEIKRELEEKGGSKVMSVHDYLRRLKRRMRTEVIMNQKENSVADLAAALTKMKDWAATYNRALTWSEYDQTWVRGEPRSTYDRFVEIAERTRKESEAIDLRIRKLKAKLVVPKPRAPRGRLLRIEEMNREPQKEIQALELDLARGEHARRALAKAPDFWAQQLAELDEQIRPLAAQFDESKAAAYTKARAQSKAVKSNLARARRELAEAPEDPASSGVKPSPAKRVRKSEREKREKRVQKLERKYIWSNRLAEERLKALEEEQAPLREARVRRAQFASFLDPDAARQFNELQEEWEAEQQSTASELERRASSLDSDQLAELEEQHDRQAAASPVWRDLSTLQCKLMGIDPADPHHVNQLGLEFEKRMGRFSRLPAPLVEPFPSKLRTREEKAKPPTPINNLRVLVEWADRADADAAESWPPLVRHRLMGSTVKNTAPYPPLDRPYLVEPLAEASSPTSLSAPRAKPLTWPVAPPPTSASAPEARLEA